MATTPVKEVVKQVRPLLSTNEVEAKRRVLNLYKQWCRLIEHMNVSYKLPLGYDEAAKKIRSDFLKHKDIRDIRVIDMMVIKSQKELNDIKNRFLFTCNFYYKYDKMDSSTSAESKNFLKKFLSGVD